MPANLENSTVATGLEKVNFHSNPKKDNAKECPNYRTVALISHASKVMFKILQAMLQQYVNWELPDVQARFRKGRGIKDQIANIRWIIEKAREFQKNIYFCFIDYAKFFDCVDHNKLLKILKVMGIADTLSASLVAQMVKRLSTMWETWVQSLGWEDSLEKEMATHSSTSCLEKPMDGGAWCRLLSMGSQRVRHDWATSLSLLSASWETYMQV